LHETSLEELQEEWPGNFFERVTWTAARSFTVDGYNIAMPKLRSVSPEVAV